MNETVQITMRRTGADGTSCSKMSSRLKYDYSIEDHLREYDEHTRETIDDVSDQLASMSPSDLQSMVDRMDCEQHMQLRTLFSSWTCTYSSNHPKLETEEGEDYAF
jgi:hypothetical protein